MKTTKEMERNLLIMLMANVAALVVLICYC